MESKNFWPSSIPGLNFPNKVSALQSLSQAIFCRKGFLREGCNKSTHFPGMLDISSCSQESLSTFSPPCLLPWEVVEIHQPGAHTLWLPVRSHQWDTLVGDWREKVLSLLVPVRGHHGLVVSAVMKVTADGHLYPTFFLVSETCFLLSALWP